MSKPKKLSKQKIIKVIKQTFEFQKTVKFRDGKVMNTDKLVVDGKVFENVMKKL